jgi:hypothetical protein
LSLEKHQILHGILVCQLYVFGHLPAFVFHRKSFRGMAGSGQGR